MENQRIIRPNDLVKLLGVSRTTLYNCSRKPDFPAKIKLSNGPVCGAVGWRLSEIEQWIEARKVAK